jgi:hypothetical protein
MMFVFGANSASTGYNLTRSVRLRASASATLSRTPATTTNRQIFTWSGWVKLGAIGSANAPLFQGYLSSTERTTLGYQSDVLYFIDTKSGTSVVLGTAAVYRDPSAWYHVVAAVDTTQATASNRTKIYVNNVLQTMTGSYVAQNTNTYINANNLHYIGNDAGAAGRYLDGYLTEVNFIDGQALTPSSFGSTNALTGVWQPARYTGTYGTNGFYLNFTDNSALTTSSNVGLGRDYSGNGNYWVTNNISITAGVTYDSMTDVPTLTSATAANFAVLNPLFISTSAGTQNATLSQGNLAFVGNVTNDSVGRSTIGVTTGSFYCEVTIGNVAAIQDGVGIAYTQSDSTRTSGVIYRTNGDKCVNNTVTSYGSSYVATDVIGIALNATSNQVTFYKNNVSQGAISFTPTTAIYFSTYGINSATSFSGNINFGQRPFTYTPPTGFVALNTYNLPTSTIVKGNTVMDATLWAGNSSTQSIVNAAPFKPDFVWIKNRTGANNHALFDSVRGATLRLYSDSTIAEQTEATTLTAFNSNGFSVSSSGAVNASANNYVGWQWQAGQGSTSSNTNGTITSTVSVNASAGFSVVTYTGNGTNPSTIGHGLGVAPSLIIVKNRNSALYDWNSYHISLGNTQYIALNTTAAASSAASLWNNTTPTSSVFTVNHAAVNTSANTLVAYCWTPIAGYSAFGSYTGNGSTDGPFVYLGFRPRWVLIKMSSSTGDWYLYDSARDPYNATAKGLIPNSSASETTYTGWGDLVSNGFKIRRTDAAWNSSGGTYIYMAFAENPFKNALAR